MELTHEQVIEIFTVPLVDPTELADFHRYSDEDLGSIKSVITACQAYLYNADAWYPDNPLTKMIIMLMAGHFLENRDLMSLDMKYIEHFPISLTALIDVLRFYRDTPVPQELVDNLTVKDEGVDA